MFYNSKWIWPENTFKSNQRVNFFFNVQLDNVPDKAEICIGCETKYWLFVNGELAVFDGGLFRESVPGCGWYDRVDIKSYLNIGHNEIVIHVWYYGNGGRNNSFCEKGGVIVSCSELGIYSGKNTKCCIDNAYYTTDEQIPSYLYGGDNTAYNAQVRAFSLCPVRDGDVCAEVVGEYVASPWGKLIERFVPQLFFTERISCTYTKQSEKYIVKLPHAMQFSPYIKLIAQGGEIIDIRSDRYNVKGGPGDPGTYCGHRAEYICREGAQEFEMLDWIFGESIVYTIPDSVTVVELGYRQSGYDSAVTTDFECNDSNVNILFQKCVRTLQVCMRENYMDCPDRERGQWIGDVSVQAPQIVYLLDNNGLLLLRKAICDFINLRKGDRLVGNVPGDNYSELPSQSLNAISEWGMIATYYNATGDKSILESAFEPSVRYLMLWETDADGVVLPRKGDWEWYDHLYNCDEAIINICWYYSALRFAITMSTKLDNHTYDEWLIQRARAIEREFEKRYWDKDKRYFTSGALADDRANALAVLSGLCDKQKFSDIRYLLMSVFNSSTYMENYVLMALCEMGYKQDAFRRMMCRYQPLIQNSNTTLWEDFFHMGTFNHAWSGGPATVLLRYFAGICNDLTHTPVDISPLTEVKCSFCNRDGERITIEKHNK